MQESGTEVCIWRNPSTQKLGLKLMYECEVPYLKPEIKVLADVGGGNIKFIISHGTIALFALSETI